MAKALIQAARAVLAVATIGVFWIFSAWTAGSTAMTGLAVMMVFFATAENPAQMALTFVMAVALSMIVGFFGMVVVVPQVGDFVPLAALPGAGPDPVGPGHDQAGLRVSGRGLLGLLRHPGRPRQRADLRHRSLYRQCNRPAARPLRRRRS